VKRWLTAKGMRQFVPNITTDGASWFKVEGIFVRNDYANFTLQTERNSVTLSPTGRGGPGFLKR